jgi:radical SAM protein with 4Fe4S-binding SPASM domain
MVAVRSLPRRLLDLAARPARGMWRAVRRDLAGVCRLLRSARPASPGLYTYRVLLAGGGQRRIHLRVEEDRHGLLLIDVSQAVHLNPTAAELVKWALDGVPFEQAEAWLRGRHPRRTEPAWRRDLTSLYQLVEQFRESPRGNAPPAAEPAAVIPATPCPTGSLPFLQRAELFSQPVRAPYKADLALTYQCNNACTHCYNAADRLACPTLPPDRWRQVIDRLLQIGIPQLIFTGGEPTLYPQLPELIRHADHGGAICGLNTNGRRLARREFAEGLRAAGLNHVQITLGSHRPEVHNGLVQAGSFEETVAGIEHSLACGLHTITNTTLMRENVAQIVDTVDFLHRLGLRTFAVNGMIRSGRGRHSPQAIPVDELPAVLVQIRDRAAQRGMRFLWYTPTEYCRLSPVELEIGARRCNAGESTLCVEPNGDVLPCQSYYVAAGNLLRDSWEQIYQSELFRRFRDRQSAPQSCGLPEPCWDCPDLPLCGGGCPLDREAETDAARAETTRGKLL